MKIPFPLDEALSPYLSSNPLSLPFYHISAPKPSLPSSILSKPTLTSQRDRGNEEVDFGVGFVTRIDVGAVFWIVVGAIFWIVVIAGNFSSRSRERIRKTVEKVMAIGVIDRVNVVIALVVCLSLSRSSRS
ncbi:unnamed protein product [Prunus armeniaca]|uniref:Transmembrane protein n=1 Tax=Prunus armeniaca TaxID=36596 RepID=A0A6J5VN15_PRUAR|nr:unnamed protein product [Prunus armeniaca]